MGVPEWVKAGRHTRIKVMADSGHWVNSRLVAGRIPLAPGLGLYPVFVPQVVNPGRSAHAMKEHTV